MAGIEAIVINELPPTPSPLHRAHIPKVGMERQVMEIKQVKYVMKKTHREERLL